MLHLIRWRSDICTEYAQTEQRKEDMKASLFLSLSYF